MRAMFAAKYRLPRIKMAEQVAKWTRSCQQNIIELGSSISSEEFVTLWFFSGFSLKTTGQWVRYQTVYINLESAVETYSK